MSGVDDEPKQGEPDGDEEKGRPKDDRGRTETVLEEGLPEADQRKPRIGPDAEGE